jgi:hypothetical protein
MEIEAFFMDSSFPGETSRVAKLIPESRKHLPVVNYFFSTPSPLSFDLAETVLMTSNPCLFLICAQLSFQDSYPLS